MATISPSSRPSRPRDAAQTVQALLALPELGMRVAWLDEKLLEGPLDAVARVFDEIARNSQSTDPRSREALLAIAIVLSQRAENAWRWALSEVVKDQHLLNLERLLRPSAEAEPAPLSTRAPEGRVPDYGVGRELTVGERRTMARRPTRLQLERLLLDPHPLVLEQLLKSPGLTEEDVVSVATRRPPSLDALRLLVASPRWIARRRVRMSLILNPGAPHEVVLPFVSTCPREDLKLIASTTTISQTIRTVALELFRRLPPVSRATSHPLRH